MLSRTPCIFPQLNISLAEPSLFTYFRAIYSKEQFSVVLIEILSKHSSSQSYLNAATILHDLYIFSAEAGNDEIC